MAENQTNPTPVVVTQVPASNPPGVMQPTPLAGPKRVSMPSNMGQIPRTPTPITPVRRK